MLLFAALLLCAQWRQCTSGVGGESDTPDTPVAYVVARDTGTVHGAPKGTSASADSGWGGPESGAAVSASTPAVCGVTEIHADGLTPAELEREFAALRASGRPAIVRGAAKLSSLVGRQELAELMSGAVVRVGTAAGIIGNAGEGPREMLLTKYLDMMGGGGDGGDGGGDGGGGGSGGRGKGKLKSDGRGTAATDVDKNDEPPLYVSTDFLHTTQPPPSTLTRGQSHLHGQYFILFVLPLTGLGQHLDRRQGQPRPPFRQSAAALRSALFKKVHWPSVHSSRVQQMHAIVLCSTHAHSYAFDRGKLFAQASLKARARVLESFPMRLMPASPNRTLPSVAGFSLEVRSF